MTWPVTSDGIRSGVNCTRLKSRSSAAAVAFTSNVLATPGTPSSNTWPRTRSATINPVITASCPTTALATSSRTARTAARGSTCIGRELSLGGTGDLRAQRLEGSGQLDQAGLVGRGRSGKQREHVVGATTGATGSG